MIYSKMRMNELEAKKKLAEKEKDELRMMEMYEEYTIYGEADNEAKND